MPTTIPCPCCGGVGCPCSPPDTVTITIVDIDHSYTCPGDICCGLKGRSWVLTRVVVDPEGHPMFGRVVHPVGVWVPLSGIGFFDNTNEASGFFNSPDGCVPADRCYTHYFGGETFGFLDDGVTPAYCCAMSLGLYCWPDRGCACPDPPGCGTDKIRGWTFSDMDGCFYHGAAPVGSSSGPECAGDPVLSTCRHLIFGPGLFGDCACDQLVFAVTW